jgi:hypothetical protein
MVDYCCEPVCNDNCNQQHRVLKVFLVSSSLFTQKCNNETGGWSQHADDFNCLLGIDTGDLSMAYKGNIS